MPSLLRSFLLLVLFAPVLSSAATPSFADFDRRANAGERLNVVFFGASLTWGANASDPNFTSYRGVMARKFEAAYPNARVSPFAGTPAAGLRSDAAEPAAAFAHVGFYTHGGWVFDYPFAPRAWQRTDYAAMFGLLKKMDFDTVQVWPLLEAIPMPLTDDDRAELRGFRGTLDDARGAGLRVWVTACANLTTPPSIAAKPWRERNPYPVMRTIRFDSAAESAAYLAHRRAMFEIVNNADGYVTIDGDPGGYAGAKPEHFADVFVHDRATINKFGTHPAQQPVIPWVWSGWGTKGVWAEPSEPFLRAELDALRTRLTEPWEILAGRSEREGHANGRINMRLIAESGLEARSTLLFYEAIEPEPVPPAAILRFREIRRYFAEESALRGKARGVMGNAQQPVMVLPNIYLFARIARDAAYADKSDDAVLSDFAAFLGGPPAVLLPAWKCLSLPLAELPAELPAQLRGAKLAGEPAAFIPGGPALYLDILAAQVESRRRMLAALAGLQKTDADSAATLAESTDALVSWWKRHHFVFSADPGTDFEWMFVHSSQFNELAAWAREHVTHKEVVALLAAGECIKRGTLPETIAAARMRQLLGL